VTASLKQKGDDLLHGVRDGIDEQWATLKSWCDHFGGYVFDAIGDVTASLKQKGIDLIAGLMDGWTEKSNELAGWAQNLGSWIAGQVGDLSGSLYQAGVDVVQGLINGINSMLGPLGDAVGGVLGVIAKIPGMGNSPWPTMIEAGNDAMTGLIIGWQSRQGDLERAVGTTIGAFGYVSAGPAAILGISSGGAEPLRLGNGGGGGGAGGATNHHYYIDLSGAIVGRQALQELRSLIAEGAIATYDRRSLATSLAGRTG
jgi:hypothetical protein